MIRKQMWSLLVVAAWCGSTWAADDKPAAKPQEPKAVTPSVTLAKDKPAIAGHWTIVAKEIKLTDEQKGKLETILKERADSVAKFDAANGSKMKELDEAAKKAKAGKDEAAFKTANDELKKLKTQREAAGDSVDVDAKLLPLLTPEQKQGYRAYGLFFAATIKFGKADLTADQKKTVKTMAADLAKPMTDQSTEKEVTKIKSDLYAKVTAEVLTEAQKTALTQKAPAKKPATAPAPAPKEPAPK